MRYSIRFVVPVVAVALLLIAAPVATAAEPAPKPADKPVVKPTPTPDLKALEDFYGGKMIRIIVGAAPGGTYDIYSRLLARHMRRYIPGNPTIIVQNRTGAGQLIAANAVYNLEPKDGTVIGSFSEGLILLQAIGAPGIEFDAGKYQWIGSLVNSAQTCVARTDSGIASFQDLIDGKPFVVGTQPPGSTTYNTPAIMNAALGTQMKLVTGYRGVAEIVLATEGKEVQGYCASWLGMLSTGRHLELLKGGIIKFIVIMGDKTPDHSLLKGVPAAETLARTDEARQLLRAMHAPSQITNPYVVHPDVPKDRVGALRKAFWAAVTDGEFLADAEKINAVFTPSTGERVTQVVQAMLSTSPAALSKMKKILLR
ncbi:MAG: hypothetical protein HYY46_18275 [Deltaproteobacteria bacterium]|nr:hypothetical protein [Deltaproteobacteria bacterium]